MSKEVLNMKYYKGEDLYSDGDIEDEILAICKSNNDFTEILMNSSEWPILYHLSNIRENILEWYDFKPQSNVLEIGSGCGAITGLLCKKAKRVVGIELSKKRSEINKIRNEKYNNLEIYVGNFEDIKLEEKFDYVTLIGVFEYSICYITDDNPFHKMLQEAKEYLKQDGKLIIAIENKYGLKYWAGATEDHTGKVFDGIEQYKNVERIRTFSKVEIEKMLNEVGFECNEFYYPVPDYKLPTAIYSDEYLPSVGDLRNTSISYDRDRYQLFDESIVFDALCQDNKFEYFANSFLIISSIL
jgi:SAM-dependent methyltransferase